MNNYQMNGQCVKNVTNTASKCEVALIETGQRKYFILPIRSQKPGHSLTAAA